MGVNIERDGITTLQYEGVPLYQSAAFWKYLKTCGIDKVRMFSSFTPTQGWNFANCRMYNGSFQCGPYAALPLDLTVPPESDFTPFLQAAVLAQQAGIYTHIDLMDLTNLQYDVAGSGMTTTEAWITQCAQQIAAYPGLNPNMTAIGPINEREGGTNAQWESAEQTLLGILNQYLPDSAGWILVTAGCHWNYYSNLFSTSDPFTVYPRGSLIAQIHAYDGDSVTNTISWWQGVASAAATWSAANGNIPVMWGESGLFANGDTTAQPIAPLLETPVLTALASGCGNLVPCPWAITYGTGGRLNIDDGDAILVPQMFVAFAESANFIAQQPYYTGGQGQISTTEPAGPGQSATLTSSGPVAAGQTFTADYTLHAGTDGITPDIVNWVLFHASYTYTYSPVQAGTGSTGSITVTTQNSGDLLLVWPAASKSEGAVVQAAA
jgi:hypothetical protein